MMAGQRVYILSVGNEAFFYFASNPTHNFLHAPPAGTLTKVRANGDILRYDPSTNIFGVMDQFGSPRTMFKPTDGIDYWKAQ
jgi:filamentous hemagglutinin